MTTTTVQAGYKMTEIGVIPEDWEVKKLGEIGSCIRGVSYNGELDLYAHDTKQSVRLFRSNNIQNASICLSDLQFVDNQKVKPTQYLEKGDIVICMANGSKELVGKTAFFDVKDGYSYTFGAFMGNFKINEKNADKRFTFYLFQSSTYRSFIDLLLSGSSINNLKPSDIESIEFNFPPTKEEQKAIATVLSDTDELIRSLSALIDKKRQIKQGAMQELLTGKKRLAGFSGEWEMKKLGEIGEIQKGELITEKMLVCGHIPVIAGGKKPAYFHNKANRINPTITVSASGASAGYVAKHNYPIFASDCSTIEGKNNSDLNFIFYLLKNSQNRIYYMQTGGAQPHIHPKDLAPMKFSVPKDKEEQKAIAQILSDMDSEITALEQKREKYRLVKQGMMQQLLTGKIRLVTK